MKSPNPPSPFLARTVLPALLACGLTVLSACSEKKAGGASQVAAEVNQGEVSIHQINLVLQRQTDLRPEQAEGAGRAALERLIQLELAVQKASEAKVDRDPQVVQALDFARREVLARAYIDRLAEAAPKPTPQEIDKFYEERPALFKNRHIYSVQEIGVMAPGETLPTLQAKLQAAKTSAAMLAELATSGLPYTLTGATRPAEDWPLPVLDQLAGMREGQPLFLPQAQGLRVLVLTAATPAPRNADEARPSIEHFLLNERKQQKVDAELKAMRTAATVKYLGKFAQAAPAAARFEPAPAASASAVKAALDAEARSKGIQGLH